mgnify:CR=1 FL=1
MVVQIHPVEYEALALKNLAEFDQRKYGSVLFIFYERTANIQEEGQTPE